MKYSPPALRRLDGLPASNCLSGSGASGALSSVGTPTDYCYPGAGATVNIGTAFCGSGAGDANTSFSTPFSTSCSTGTVHGIVVTNACTTGGGVT